MKHLAYVAFVLTVSLGLSSPADADANYYDSICPAASSAVAKYVVLVKSETTLVADAVAAANAASAAYDVCGDRYRSAGDAEHLHYASVGSAQYRFAAGRLLRLDGHFDEARTALEAAIGGVTDTIAWGSAASPSAYKNSAIEVRDSAIAELAKLPAINAK